MEQGVFVQDASWCLLSELLARRCFFSFRSEAKARASWTRERVSAEIGGEAEHSILLRAEGLEVERFRRSVPSRACWLSPLALHAAEYEERACLFFLCVAPRRRVRL
ncbi:unnamed protein product, partial [Effrenium voratum]